MQGTEKNNNNFSHMNGLKLKKIQFFWTEVCALNGFSMISPIKLIKYIALSTTCKFTNPCINSHAWTGWFYLFLARLSPGLSLG